MEIEQQNLLLLLKENKTNSQILKKIQLDFLNTKTLTSLEILETLVLTIPKELSYSKILSGNSSLIEYLKIAELRTSASKLITLVFTKNSKYFSIACHNQKKSFTSLSDQLSDLLQAFIFKLLEFEVHADILKPLATVIRISPLENMNTLVYKTCFDFISKQASTSDPALKDLVMDCFAELIKHIEVKNQLYDQSIDAVLSLYQTCGLASGLGLVTALCKLDIKLVWTHWHNFFNLVSKGIRFLI